VTIRNRKQSARGRCAIALVLVASLASCIIGCSGCSLLKKGGGAGESIMVDDQTPRPAAPASIQVSYAKPDDTLQSVLVSQFTGANVLRTLNQGEGEASVVRFDGGVPIWKFHANRGLLSPLAGKTPYHVTSIEYGKAPPGFAQDAPEAGPPPPLDAGGYYIFAIERASGATSFQAVRVKPDLTLQAYDAEPRAGTSYKLCCNVSADFPEPTPSDIEEPASLPIPAAPDAELP
jgi:hypothetical protein